MTTSSFHTHTRLCLHASGMPADYVMRAGLEGATSLGFSDHCPYPDGTWSGCRMSVEDIPLYLSACREAALRSPFPVYTGFECEWDPRFGLWYRDFLRGECGASFLAYGPHWVKDGGEFVYIPEASGVKLLREYVDLTVRGIGSGLFDFVAHPDLFLSGYLRMNADVLKACEDIIDAAVGADLPLEINGLGMTKPTVRGDGGTRYGYPVREFWELAAERGARIICNSDAHRSEDVLAGARNADGFARLHGIPTEDAGSALLDGEGRFRLQSRDGQTVGNF